MRYFTEDHVRQLLPMSDAIKAMHSAFEALGNGEAVNQTRRRMYLKNGPVLHAMAGAYGGYFGTKVYTTHPKHGAWFTFLLFDAETARPLAQFEANYLGQIRTGAVSGLAADLLAPWPEVDVGLVGSGFQASSQIAAVSAVRKIHSVRIWSRQEEKRRKFAETIGEQLGVPAKAVESSGDATAEAHILITATNAKEPVLIEEAVREDALILATGSNDPRRREIPGEMIRKAVVVVDDIEAARIEAGDLLLALKDHEWGRVLPLADVVKHAGMHQPRNRIVFKSVGLGLEDVAAAAIIYERATPEERPENLHPSRR